MNALDEYLKQILGNNQTTFNSSLIDLAIRHKKKVIKIFEVKTSLERQAIYTGIGQLMFHSAGNAEIEKVIVLPNGDFPPKFLSILAKLKISILKYSLEKNNVILMT